MRSKNKLIILIIFLLTFSFFINVHATTIDDSSISVKQGQTYNWTYTEATDMVNTSDSIRFTVNSIYKGNYSSEKAAVLNATMSYYHSYTSSWEIVVDNEAYMYFNGTTDFMYYTPGVMLVYGFLFVLPTPFNLTLVGEYLNATFFGEFTNIIPIGNQLIMHDFDDGITMSFIFNDNGLLLRYDVLEGTTTILTLELSESEQGISLGYTFLLVMFISVIGILVYKRRKLKFT
ncbi:MAG: hypothetical protein ACFE9S_02640 [Candidatus Hermodarchaeota archaeon]